MDINNNLMGREYAENNPNLTYDELWIKAMEDSVIITSLDEVQNAYNLSDDQIFIDRVQNKDSSYTDIKYVKVFTPDNKDGESHIMNKNEYLKKVDKNV